MTPLMHTYGRFQKLSQLHLLRWRHRLHGQRLGLWQAGTLRLYHNGNRSFATILFLHKYVLVATLRLLPEGQSLCQVKKYQYCSIFLPLLRNPHMEYPSQLLFHLFSISIHCFCTFFWFKLEFWPKFVGKTSFFPLILAKMSSFHQKNGKNNEFQWKKMEYQLRWIFHMGITYKGRNILQYKYHMPQQKPISPAAFEWHDDMS